MSDKQIKLDQMGGDPRNNDSGEDDIIFLREGGQTDYNPDHLNTEPFDNVKGRQEKYTTHEVAYPLNQLMGTRLITGRWDVPFVSGPSCEILTPLLPDPLTGYGRKSIVLYNNGTVNCYIGMGQEVSAGRDFPLLPGATFSIDKDASTGIWMISSGGVTCDIRYAMEMGYVGGITGRAN